MLITYTESPDNFCLGGITANVKLTNKHFERIKIIFGMMKYGHLAGKITDELARKPIENMSIAIGDNVYS